MSRRSWMRLRAQSVLASKNSSRKRNSNRKRRRVEALENRLVMHACGMDDPGVGDAPGDEPIDETNNEPPVAIGPLSENAVFTTVEPIVLSGERGDAVQVGHATDLEVDSGAISVTFTAESVDGRQGLFSKDHRGFQDGGHITAWVRDGRVEVRLQSDERSVNLRSADNSITAGEEHQVAVSFGENGFRLYVDGLIADAAVDFDQGIADNDNPLVIGANTWGRIGIESRARDYFEGTIHDLTVFDTELGLEEAATLADLDTSPPSEVEVVDGVLTGTDAGEELTGQFVAAGYGDDTVIGTDQNDILAAGAGEDITRAGAGDDLIISRGFGREPVIAQDYSDEDPDGEVNPETDTLYPDQPVADDDLLEGGEGADTFRFEILINAKERILFKHVEDDGSIDWAGVTGENRDVHDHWVDRFGDDVILDFNREEGDMIEFVGHTVDVYKVEHVDSDGDGVLDASVMYVQSNQGNAGAHNRDQLGTVTVYGDLVRESDYTVHAHANLGIVDTIGELGEALAPRVSSPIVAPGASRWALEQVEEPVVSRGAVLATGQELSFSGEQGDYVQIDDNGAAQIDEGSVALSFEAESVDGRQTLFSKDHRGFQDGGHLTLQIVNGRLEARLQSADRSYLLRSARGSLVANQDYSVEVAFGDDGFRLILDGEVVDSEASVTTGLSANDNPIVLGASAKRRDGDNVNAREFFNGTLFDFAVFGGEAESTADGGSSTDAIDMALAMIL